MYLTKVEIDRYNRNTIRDLSHLGTYHGWVESCFSENKENRSRKLWRIDEIKNKEYLLILSEEKPNFTILEKYGVKGSAGSKSYEKLLESIVVGMKAQFRIELNAAKSSQIEDGEKRGSIVPVKNEDLNDFFLKKAKQNGFLPIGDPIIANKKVKRMKKRSEGVNVCLNSVTYEGVLEVTDVDLFKKALIKGIGKKKAYGFGLLSIIPIQSE